MVILQIIIFFLFKLCFLKYSVFPALPLFYPLIIWFGEPGSHLSLWKYLQHYMDCGLSHLAETLPECLQQVCVCAWWITSLRSDLCCSLDLYTTMLMTNPTEFCSEISLDKVFPPYLWVHPSSRWHVAAVRFISLRRNDWENTHNWAAMEVEADTLYPISCGISIFAVSWWRPGCCCRLCQNICPCPPPWGSSKQCSKQLSGGFVFKSWRWAVLECL